MYLGKALRYVHCLEVEELQSPRKNKHVVMPIIVSANVFDRGRKGWEKATRGGGLVEVGWARAN